MSDKLEDVGCDPMSPDVFAKRMRYGLCRDSVKGVGVPTAFMAQSPLPKGQ